jgi:3-oxoacyl-[acyl-carrier-protein] synthase III
MKSKSDYSAALQPAGSLPNLRLVAAVSLADSPGFFQPLGNEAILGLSRQGDRPGFRDLATIQRLTGISSRRLLQPGITPLRLVQGLWQHLQQDFGRATDHCDRVLLCHSHVDPAAAQRLATAAAGELGFPSDHVLGCNFGCTGFVQLLCEAAELFSKHPDIQRIALLTIETPETWHCSADRLFCGIVGAGATAVLVERPAAQSPRSAAAPSTTRTTSHLSAWLLTGLARADLELPIRSADAPLFSVETTDAFSFHGEPVRRSVMRMHAEEVFVHGIELMQLALRNALRTQPPRPRQRVLVLPHQPSGKLLRAFIAAARHEFPDCQFLENLEYHGNCISCTIPQQLSELTEVCRRNSLPPPGPDDLLIAVTAGICMHRRHDHMACGYALLNPC